MLSVGLTGGVASGKSEALQQFERLGAVTLSSDEIVKDLMRPGRPVVRKIWAHFGPAVLRKGGAVCREFLRERILADSSELDWLEETLHPGVRSAILDLIAKHRRKSGVLVVEVPLLFENAFDRLFDKTVAIKTRAESAERRAAARGMSSELYDFFSKRQWSAAKKAKASDLVIDNNGDLKQLARGITDAYKKFLADDLRRRDRKAS